MRTQFKLTSSFCFVQKQITNYVILNIFFKNFFITPGKLRTTIFTQTSLHYFSEKTVVIQANAKKDKKYAFNYRNHYRRHEKSHQKPGNKAEYAKNKYAFSYPL